MIEMSKTFEKFQQVFSFVLFLTLKLPFSIHEKYTLAKCTLHKLLQHLYNHYLYSGCQVFLFSLITSHLNNLYKQTRHKNLIIALNKK